MPRLTLLFLLFAFPTFAQRIEGRVTDATTGAALPFATVFINNTGYATETDTTGRFVLAKMPPGRYQLIARLVGYEALPQTVTVEAGKVVRADFALVADKNMLNEVTAKAKRDKTWENQLKQFSRYWIGADGAARQCRIINPWVIDFSQEGSSLTARASQPIEVDNRYLGYHLTYLLKSFRASDAEVQFSGYAQFSSLLTEGKGDQTAWPRQRQEAFQSSDLFLLQSIIQGKTAANGFEGYIDRPSSNPASRSANFYGDQIKKLQRINLDTLATRRSDGPGFRLVLPRRFELHSTRAEGPFTIYRDKPCPLTWIETSGPLLVSEQGLLLNPQAWLLSGFLASRRLAVMLPTDYQPGQLPTAMTEAEQGPSSRWTTRTEWPFFVTDKPYYAPKDVVRVSGTVQYAHPALQDSLSGLLHLDLVDPTTGKAFLSQKLVIENGLFQTTFALPDSLPLRPLLLRAYTHWMRNWTDSTATYRWLPVVSRLEKPVGTRPAESENLEITTADSTLTVRILESAGNRLRWVTAALLDTSAVSHLDSPVQFGLATKPIGTAPQFPMEQGVGLSGQLTNRKNQPVPDAQVLLVEPRTKTSFVALADSVGRFSFQNLPLMGRPAVLLKATNNRGKPVENIRLDAETTPALPAFARAVPQLTLQQTRLPSWYGVPAQTVSLDSMIRLDEVQVRARKAPKEPPPKYSHADYVVKGKDLMFNAVGENILVALQGRVPGLRIVEKFGEDGFRKLIVTLRGGFTGGGFQQGAATQPLLLVDGVPWNDVNDLQAIPPAMVDRIEIINRAEALMGLRGYLGVIAVYTKQMTDADTQELQTDPNIRKVTVQGIILPPLRTPTSEGVFWQPKATDRGDFWDVTFPKPTRRGTYRLVCEGLTSAGKRVVMVKWVGL